ncbi:MAG: hypothetical protein EBZ47_07790 [Chlamydiae bacterium]|nr:hypothetical protein [Chlamydiota bacterium]
MRVQMVLLGNISPKGTDFNIVTLEEIKFAQYRLNNRPRKVLGWTTPIKEFKKLIGALKT